MTRFKLRKDSPQSWVLAGFGGVTALIILLAIVGGARAWTPVPFWDMWDGTLGFYLAVQDGNTAIWWSQHNEHRIILARLLFWLDFRLFGGVGLFLTVMNYVFVALATLLFIRIGRQRWYHLDPSADPRATWHWWLLSMLLCAWLFQWIQWENFSWAFQSQFFLAQLIPLYALYTIARAADTEHRNSSRWFVGACLLGVLSAGTMANGVITLPLLTVYALLTRQGHLRVGVLLMLAVVVLGLYFRNFDGPEHHGSLSDAILTQPLALAQYVFLYLGSPMYEFFGRGTTGAIAAMTASTIMAAITLPLLVIYVRRGGHRYALPLALVFYIAYIAGTALGTGGGRLVFGVGQAVSSRYTTPALMAWAALFILLIPSIQRLFRSQQNLAVALTGLFLLFLLYAQTEAIHQRYHMKHDRKLAGMALELGVLDERQISRVYVMSDWLLDVVDTASADNIGMFGQYPWADRREQLGEIYVAEPLPACIGYLERVEPVETDPGYYMVHGWLLDPATRQVPELITIINTAREVAGFALGGQPREDVRAELGRYARISGFRGYIHAGSLSEPALLIASQPECQLQLDIPNAGTILAPEAATDAAPAATTDQGAEP